MFQLVKVFLFTIMMSKLFAETTKVELKFTGNAIVNAKTASNSFSTMSKTKHVRGGCSPFTSGVHRLELHEHDRK